MGKCKMFKTAAVLITLGYCSILVYQSAGTFNLIESNPGSELVQVSESTVKLSTTPSSNNESVHNKTLITLDDVFIGVKTSKTFEKARFPIILETWFQMAKNQTWFFTDVDNHNHQKLTNNHMVNTNCPATHQRNHLCCKTAVEFDHFILSEKKWFCHFDDDNYVNVPRLVEVLKKYDHKRDWYLGRNSIKGFLFYQKTKLSPANRFRFATFGAGMCMSRSLALKMLPVAGGGKFISVCKKLHYPDDVTMGYIVEQIVKARLTVVPEFHSHLEKLKYIPAETFRDQISFSYSPDNVVQVPGFPKAYDPTRFLSLHCFLYPDWKFCPR